MNELNQSPDMLYGALVANLDISGLTSHKAINNFKHLLDEDRWMEVGSGFKDINVFLKTIDLSDFKYSIEQRKEVSKKLADLKASQRASAKTLGVAPSTINNDVKSSVQNRTEEEETYSDYEEVTDESVQNRTPTKKEVPKEPSSKELVEKHEQEVEKKINKEEAKEKLQEKKKENAETLSKEVAENKPIIYHQDCLEFLNTLDDNSVDLLITDPPYSTDVDDINQFANSWVDLALSKIKPNGRGYICIGGYPKEINAYLNILLKQDKFIVDNPLIWSYKNTLGVTPKMKYNLNYQVVLHLYSEDSAELDTSITSEMWSVMEINAPDGRQGDRYHTWQKPDELGMRLIKHSTKEGDTIVDCFACTGTFLLMGAKMNREALGCDIDEDNLLIAKQRGCIINGV